MRLHGHVFVSSLLVTFATALAQERVARPDAASRFRSDYPGAWTIWNGSARVPYRIFGPGASVLDGGVGELDDARRAARLVIAGHGTWLGQPSLGVGVSGAGGGKIVVLGVGGSNKVWGATPLPSSLGPFGAPGCSILVALDATLAMTANSTGNASISFAIPIDPKLVGAELFGQALVLNSAANQLGLITSQAVKATLGN